MRLIGPDVAPMPARAGIAVGLALAVALAACGTGGETQPDDGASPPPADARASDAGPGRDDAGGSQDAAPADGPILAGSGPDGPAADAVTADGAPPPADGAAPADGAIPGDAAAQSDVLVQSDVLAQSDAAAGLCAASYAGCTTYTDATASGASRTITFGFAFYSPKCLQIRAGQSVTFSGTFGSHPLTPACGPAAAITGTSAGNSATFTFTVTGDYGYYCSLHGAPSGSGMAGSIRVVP
jgi:plastocyanin